MTRNRFINAAWKIAIKRNGILITKPVALRKLFIQEKRDRSRPDAPVIGWKRGEIFEVILATNKQERLGEWGDMAYYLAQSYDWLWWLYNLVTPQRIIDESVEKFEKRAREK
ncbi:MAG: hypothetical protein GF334_00245 [Candidatus Altiarchaeales archaeon]|nr:hypothetical protein [Candidatus Altiarchaeales archaeon]